MSARIKIKIKIKINQNTKLDEHKCVNDWKNIKLFTSVWAIEKITQKIKFKMQFCNLS